mmetsp:Transcript_18711/g.71150  ORF Transcript_18711/g.71150 Transcript_18711/m.71150 type:complete len:270 (+) Transcript_18711:2990-3799(+)
MPRGWARYRLPLRLRWRRCGRGSGGPRPVTRRWRSRWRERSPGGQASAGGRQQRRGGGRLASLRQPAGGGTGTRPRRADAGGAGWALRTPLASAGRHDRPRLWVGMAGASTTTTTPAAAGEAAGEGARCFRPGSRGRSPARGPMRRASRRDRTVQVRRSQAGIAGGQGAPGGGACAWPPAARQPRGRTRRMHPARATRRARARARARSQRRERRAGPELSVCPPRRRCTGAGREQALERARLGRAGRRRWRGALPGPPRRQGLRGRRPG